MHYVKLKNIKCFSGVTGHYNSIHSNSISYEMFNNGCAVFAFDLSTNQEAAIDPFSLTTCRAGKYF